MSKLTIHRALAELKLIDKKVEKGISNFMPVGMYQKDKPVNGIYTLEKFNENAKSRLESLQSLVSRKNKIKNAVVLVNATTKIQIGDETMTIAEAITRRDNIEAEKKLLEHLEECLSVVKTELEQNNTQVDGHALKLAEVALQKDNVKIDDTDAMTIIKPYLAANKFLMADPLGLEKLVEDMSDKINTFDTEVDATLSEINATTFIEID